MALIDERVGLPLNELDLHPIDADSRVTTSWRKRRRSHDAAFSERSTDIAASRSSTTQVVSVARRSRIASSGPATTTVSPTMQHLDAEVRHGESAPVEISEPRGRNVLRVASRSVV